jgi:N4-gp56 family major capsid protein
MADTHYGVNSPEAVKLWSKKLFREALKDTWCYKFMGTSSNEVCQILSDTHKGPGDRVRSILRMQLSGAGVSGDGTLEGFEESLTTYTDDFLIDQLRHAVRSEGKMSEQRVPFSVREEARMGLKDWWSDRIDSWFMNQLTGNTAQADLRYTGNNATIAPDASHVLFGSTIAVPTGSETSISATTTHFFNLELIDRAVAKAKTLSPMIRPIKEKGNDYYVAFIHPFQVYQLRTQATANTGGQWADIQRAAIQGGDGSDNPIWTGALGVYNGTILHESTRIPAISTAAGSGTGRRAVFCGAQAAVFGTGQKDDATGNEMSWFEELFDYGNKLGVSAGLIGGLKKNQFNSLDFATIAISTHSPTL